MNHIYEVYLDRDEDLWCLKAEGIFLQAAEQESLVETAIEMIAAIAELGFRSQLLVRDENGKVQYRG